MSRAHPARANAHSTSRTAHARLGLFAALAVWAAAAVAQDRGIPPPTDTEPKAAAERWLAEDALRLCRAADGRTRGEAALLLAAGRDPHDYEAILAVAKDSDPEARVRGIVALGHLAAPGCEGLLRDLLDASGTRPRPEGVAAAFALGLLPDDRAPAITSDFLTRVRGASLKRQRDVVLALLLGLSTRSAPSQQQALAPWFDDASVRDPALRAAALLASARLPHGLDETHWNAALQSADAEERRAALAAAADRVPDGLLGVVRRLAGSEPEPGLRALALAALTRGHDEHALELAWRAARSDDPSLAEQGGRSALVLGGSGARATLAALLDSAPAGRLQGLANAWQGALPEAAQARLRGTLADRKAPIAVRAAAAAALGRAEAADMQSALRAVFVEATDARDLRRVAHALVGLPDPALPLERLHAGSAPTDLALDPPRLAALLAARHPHAVRFCMQLLAQKDLSPPLARGVLQACRIWRLPPLPSAIPPLLPPPLRDLFGG